MFRKASKANQIHQKLDFLDLRSYHQDFQTHSHGSLQTLSSSSTNLKNMATKIQVICPYILSHHLKKAVVVYPDKSLHLFHLQIPHM